jgi:AhpD family alkylhydroperoxidase
MSHARGEQNDFKALAPDVSDILLALSHAAAKAGIDKQLLELIKLRASQINGCAFCVQFHSCRASASALPPTSSTLS